MGLRGKAQFEKMYLRQKVSFLMRSVQKYNMYSVGLISLIELIKEKKEKGLLHNRAVLLVDVFAFLKVALSIKEILAITLNKENTQYSLRYYTGFNNIKPQDCAFDINNAFIKELRESSALAQLYNFKHCYSLKLEYDFMFVMPLSSMGVLMGAIMFEKPSGPVFDVFDKYYLRLIVCLVEFCLLDDYKDRSFYKDLISKMRLFLDEASSEIGKSKELDNTLREQIQNTIHKLKSILYV